MGLRYTDGTQIDNDCLAAVNEAIRNMHELSELGYLFHYNHLAYADIVINGDVIEHLRNVTAYFPREDRERYGKSHV